MRRIVAIAVVLVVTAGPVWAQTKTKPKESPAVAAMREKLKTKVTVDFKETRLADVADELKKQVDGLSIYLDSTGGVSRNQAITYSATDKPLSEVLDEICTKGGLGYVIGKPNGKYPARYVGWLIITKGRERGDEAGESTAATPGTEKPETTKPKTEKPVTEAPAESDTEKAEREAGIKLRLAKQLQADGLTDKARERLQDVVKQFPGTKAAEEAKQLLDKSGP